MNSQLVNIIRLNAQWTYRALLIIIADYDSVFLRVFVYFSAMHITSFPNDLRLIQSNSKATFFDFINWTMKFDLVL